MLSHRQLFLRHLAQTSPAPLALEIEHAEGLYLYDTGGKAYLDLIAGIGVSCLGHRHPRVEAAVRDQLARYWHTLVYGEYVLAPQVQLAALLAGRLPGLDAVYFVNSGAEATEGAMKLAKRYTGRPGIIACRRGYHGSTQGAASLMDPPDFTLAYHPLLPGIRHIDFNSDPCLEKIDRRTAAVIVETVQAESGIFLPRLAWLQALRRRCDETGALLILDEVQAGYGRTGHLFAFEPYGIRPDILLLAKGFGGGMPIGAFVASGSIMQVLSFDPPLGHITTFGGHPVSAAAALATLQVLLETGLIAQVPAKEQLFRERLQHPRIKDLRSAGLWMAVDLGDAAFVQRVIRHCLDRGVITDWFLFNDRCLRIAPPLTIEAAQIEAACAVLLEALDAG
ncbi:MAG: aspartate aminotransferase family protein [Saprospirales bacterium]|jgi:acetylornithine/succinyldiaminopimelate/putrescine aminotransferase|nr:aspartate aminotransferase family protein [Saprospirales bacterium]MBK8923248.1 aspartate aminotransferase family protein [Saprospirales bacterium]